MTKLVRTDAPRSAPRTRRGYLVRGTIAPVFVERGALSPPDAIPFTPRDAGEAKAFERMRRTGALRAAGANWWLDMVAYRADADAQSRRLVPYLIIGSLVAALLAVQFYSG